MSLTKVNNNDCDTEGSDAMSSATPTARSLNRNAEQRFTLADRGSEEMVMTVLRRQPRTRAALSFRSNTIHSSQGRQRLTRSADYCRRPLRGGGR